jgi:hypothetical protein
MTRDVDISAAAAAMGRAGGSKPKNYSPEELKRRTDLLKAARAARWAGHKKKGVKK